MSKVIMSEDTFNRTINEWYRMGKEDGARDYNAATIKIHELQEKVIELTRIARAYDTITRMINNIPTNDPNHSTNA